MKGLKHILRRGIGSWIALQKTLLLKHPETDNTNILCLVPQVTIGGAEKVIQCIVDGLSCDGFNFYLLAQCGDTNSWCQHFLKSFKHVILLNAWEKFRHPVIFECVLWRTIKKANITIMVISNDRPPYLLLERLKIDFPKLRIIDILHAEHPDYIHTNSSFLDQRVCVSAAVRSFVLSQYERKKMSCNHDITVIGNGSDAQHFKKDNVSPGSFRRKYGISNSSKIISFVGRIAPEKRPLLFAKIAEAVCRMCLKDVVFVMAGDGEQMSELKDLIKEYSLEKHFILTGACDTALVRELFNDAFLHLITSLSEGAPLVLIEAMLMEVPVMTTDVGNCREVIIESCNGYILQEEQLVKEAARLVVSMVLSPETRDAMAANCRSTVIERFSLQSMQKQYKSLFQQLSCPAPVRC